MDDASNHEILAAPLCARVIVLHRAGDSGAGAQVELNTFGCAFEFDAELANRGTGPRGDPSPPRRRAPLDVRRRVRRRARPSARPSTRP